MYPPSSYSNNGVSRNNGFYGLSNMFGNNGYSSNESKEESEKINNNNSREIEKESGEINNESRELNNEQEVSGIKSAVEEGRQPTTEQPFRTQPQTAMGQEYESNLGQTTIPYNESNLGQTSIPYNESNLGQTINSNLEQTINSNLEQPTTPYGLNTGAQTYPEQETIPYNMGNSNMGQGYPTTSQGRTLSEYNQKQSYRGGKRISRKKYRKY